MRIATGVLTGLALFACTAPAFALCDLCSPTLRLDDTLASCFLERAEAETARLEESGGAFLVIDLSDCEGRGALPTGAPAEAAQRPLDATFIADAAAIACLSDAILALPDGPGPGHDFDLAALCP